MNLLKRLFPCSFEPKKSIAVLAKEIAYYPLFGFFAVALLAFVYLIFPIGWGFELFLRLIEAYVAVGILLSILSFLNILK